MQTVRRQWPAARAEAVALAGVLLVGAFVRFQGLGSQSLWLDEAATHNLATTSFSDMVSRVAANETSPPLFYLLTWVVAHTLGTGDFWLRFLSACAGAVLLVVVFRIAALVFDRRTAIYATWLAAGSPILVWFSQEARSYALAICLSTTALLLFLKALERPTLRLLAGWGALSLLAAATHYFALLPFALEGLLLWLRAPAGRRSLAIVLGLSVPVVAALAILANHQRTHVRPDAWIALTPLSQRTAQVVKQFLVGYDGPWQALLAVAAALLVGVFAVIPLLRWRDLPRGALELGIVGVATVVLPILAAAAGFDYLVTRNVLFALPPLVVLAAAGFARVRPQTAGAAAVVALGLIGMTTTAFVAAKPIYQRPQWRVLAERLANGPRPAVAVVTPASAIVPMRIYEPGLRVLTGPVAVRDVEAATVAEKSGAGESATIALRNPLTPPSPAFRESSRTQHDTYAVVGYHADQPVQLTPQAAAAAGLTDGASVVIAVPPRS